MSSEIELLCQNAVEIIDRAEFETRLLESRKNKKPLRVKAGFDPSAPDIHLGHTVLLRKLRQFQDLGHRVVFIIGDFTARVGDPTGQTKTRPPLSKKEVEKNAKTYQRQAFKILDDDPKKIEIVRNSQWLASTDMFQVFFEKISPHATVDQLLEREDFDKRRKAHRPITFREFLYPLLQGYDSVKVKADVELGGTDQKFNLLMGRDLQSKFNQRPQIVMTMPLLVGLDGTMKMSKSLGNYVAVTDRPSDMFGKVMSIPDRLMETYYDLLTPKKGREVAEAVSSGAKHPLDAKRELAEEIVKYYYGENKAKHASQEFDRIFCQKLDPEKPEEFGLTNTQIWIVELLKTAGAIATGSEARRLVQQGAVTLDGQKIMDPKAIVTVRDGSLLRVGKRKFIKLIVQKSS